MDGLLDRAPGPEDIRALCGFLEDHRGEAVTALDLRELHSWTDFFVIATVSSGAHRDGILRQIREFTESRGLHPPRPARGGKNAGGGDWTLLDMGTAVVHLMGEKARAFYELESLWSTAGRLYP